MSHILIAGAVCAVFNPAAVPAAVLGSTAPDWLEMLRRGFTRGKVAHRAATHYLAGWLAGMVFAALVWDWGGLVFWFCAGGAVHWFCDALTVSGAPVGWWSDRRVTLFGGKVYTGSPAEYFITGLVVLVCAVVVWQRSQIDPGFLPFFYNWGGLYGRGLVDGLEWRTNRFNFF